jgi:hypothetical protein
LGEIHWRNAINDRLSANASTTGKNAERTGFMVRSKSNNMISSIIPQVVVCASQSGEFLSTPTQQPSKLEE